MKLVTFALKSNPKQVRVGIVNNGLVMEVSPQPDNMVQLIEQGQSPLPGGRDFPLAAVEFKAPLLPRKIIGIGRNYAAHAAELGNMAPGEPILFVKLTSSVIGPGATICWRESLTTQVDWEGELAVIIGAPAYCVKETAAMDHVFGYTIANDVSARDLQSQDQQWTRAKGLDSFCPLGPWIVTSDEIANPHALNIRTAVNGEVMQNAHTGLMIFKIPALIAYCSQAFTLQPGDVILTGTPAGVGKGMNPPRFLQDGDSVTINIDGIGEISNSSHVMASRAG